MYFSSGDIQHPLVRWTTSQRSRISIPFSPRLRDHSVGGCLMLISWSYFVHESLLCRGAAKLCSIPIIFLMSLGGARGFASRVWNSLFLLVVRCYCQLFMEGGKDMSLPIYTSLYLTAVVFVLLLF
jgi:hypothetical protein